MRRIVLYLVFIVITPHVFSQDSLWVGRTTGKFPFLEYGIGDDRLGGAKEAFLDSNIMLRIVDSFNTDYKVQLSKLHSAYIAKTSVVLQYKAPVRPIPHNTHLSGSMKVFGDSASDVLMINLDERMPYHAFQQIDPYRVAVDLFGVTSNTNWITQLRTTREISNTWYEQVEDDVLRVYIQLKHARHWGFGLAYDSSGRKLVVRIRRQPPVMDIRKLRIAVDAGHGGDNAGADGVNSKVLEKEYTLLIAKELEKTLKKAGVRQVFMTRQKDTSLSMPERMEMLRQFSPDLLVSIHLNSAGSDTVQGTSTYYRYIGFRPLSVAILDQMLTLGLKEYGNVGNFNFSLSGPTEYPNALVEVAFLSNPADEKKILSPIFRKAVARKIYLGIVNWLKPTK